MGELKMQKIATFSVFYEKDISRTIEISVQDSLSDLAEAIIDAYDFEMDHMYGFYSNIKDIYGDGDKYELFADMDDCETEADVQSVDKTTIESAFSKNNEMVFLFDYGDDWNFLVQKVGVSDEEEAALYPRLVSEMGAAPIQYPMYEE
jgi:hypothetical protein